MKRTRIAIAAAAAGALVFVPTLVTASTAGAASETQTTVRKIVLVKAAADGAISSNRLIVQVAANGTGTGEVLVPVGASAPRNLTGFAPTRMDGDSAVYAYDLSGGEQSFRSVVDNTSPLPVTVSVAVTLDGQAVAPADVVGKSGRLEVTYTVKNITTRNVPISYVGPDGAPVTEEVPVSVPMGGSIDIDLPSEFVDVEAPGANVAGDGSGGTKLSFSLVLFEPLGAPEGTVKYSATINGGSFPAATVSILPILPLDNSTVASTYAAYKGGVETGETVAGAGTQIGENLVKIATGAGQLFSGLNLLDAGAKELSAGLNDTAVPGSAQLAAGAGELSAGLSDRLAPGGELLASGANLLAAGATGELAPGAKELSAGLNGRIAPGAQALAEALADQLAPGAAALEAGVQQIAGGLAQLDDATTGLPALQAGIGTVTDVPPTQTLYAALNGVNAGLGQLKTSVTDLSLLASGTVTSFDTLAGGVTSLQTNGDCTASCQGTVTNLLAAIGSSTDVYPTQTTLYGSLNALSGGLTQVLAAIGDSATPGSTLLYGMTAGLAGMASVSAGVNSAVAGVDALATGAGAAVTGAGQVADGADLAAEGATDLSDGTVLAAAGARQLARGARDVAEGSTDLAAGADELSAGLDTAAGGASQVAGGASQLAEGLVPAAEGSTQIADGLGQAAPGAEEIQQGATALNEQGAQQLVVSGNEGASGFSRDLAIIDAAQAIAETGAGIPFGPSTGASQTTAVYQFQLAGVSVADKSGPLRWILALVVLVIAGALGGFMWARSR